MTVPVAPGGDRARVSVSVGVPPELAFQLFTAEIGRVLAWEPPRRFVFNWRAANFAPAEHTEVEVLFEPAEHGTRVTVTHSGFASLRPDHPVRHGKSGPAFSRELGMWWADLLRAWQRHCQVAGADPTQ